MTARSAAASIDEYIAGFPPEIGQRLQEVRELVLAVAPCATERISYAIPTFDLDGRHLVFFAGFAKHVGFYPITAIESEEFAEELNSYKRGKGSVQFPHDRPLPTDLIRRLIEFRVRESRSAGGS